MQRLNTPLFASLTLILVLLGLHCAQPATGESRLRLANYLVTNPELSFRVLRAGAEELSLTLPYGETSPYLSFPTGNLTLQVRSAETLLLEKTIGIGSHGQYTFTATGLVPATPETNPRTSHTRWLYRFEGEAAASANGGLPQLNTYLDRFTDRPDRAQVRWIHQAPGVKPLELSLHRQDHEVSLGTSHYPAGTSMHALAPGRYSVEVRLSGSPLVLYAGSIELRAGSLSTLYVIGSPEHYLDSLQVRQLDTPGN